MTVAYVLPRDLHVDPDIVAAWLWQAGASGVWIEPDTITAYYPGEVPHIPPGGRWHAVAEVDWATAWRDGLTPVVAGPFEVVPTWLADEHHTDPSRIRIVLDPGRAFGSGHHDTTMGCLEELARLDLSGRSVLDVGTGSGVLAIAAALRGAGRVVGVDLDPDAIAVARANAAGNGVAIDLAVGSVQDAEGPFDVVVANLLTHTLVALADDLAALVAAEGRLIASGIGALRAAVVTDALERAGLVEVHARERGDWAVVTARQDSRATVTFP